MQRPSDAIRPLHAAKLAITKLGGVLEELDGGRRPNYRVRFGGGALEEDYEDTDLDDILATAIDMAIRIGGRMIAAAEADAPYLGDDVSSNDLTAYLATMGGRLVLGAERAASRMSQYRDTATEPHLERRRVGHQHQQQGPAHFNVIFGTANRGFFGEDVTEHSVASDEEADVLYQAREMARDLGSRMISAAIGLRDAPSDGPLLSSRRTPFEIAREAYDEALFALQPRERAGNAFLYGEPADHNGKGNAPQYTQFYEHDGRYYRGAPVTVERFHELHRTASPVIVPAPAYRHAPITRGEYDAARHARTPAKEIGTAFLYGEPADHDGPGGAPRYTHFYRANGSLWRGHAVTVNEFFDIVKELERVAHTAPPAATAKKTAKKTTAKKTTAKKTTAKKTAAKKTAAKKTTAKKTAAKKTTAKKTTAKKTAAKKTAPGAKLKDGYVYLWGKNGTIADALEESMSLSGDLKGATFVGLGKDDGVMLHVWQLTRGESKGSYVAQTYSGPGYGTLYLDRPIGEQLRERAERGDEDDD